MKSRSELLTEAFFLWEQRGRGYKEWDERVCLEPLFVPFYGHNLYVDVKEHDDGRIPGFFDKVSAKFKKPVEADDFHPIELLSYPEETPDFLCKDFEHCTEFRISFPEMYGGKGNSFVSLTSLLSQLNTPISYEIIGTESDLSVLFSVPERAADSFESILQTRFPELTLQKKKEFLQNSWLSIEAEATEVISFGLDQEFLKPLASGHHDPLIGIYSLLDNLGMEQIGVFQVIFAPILAPWAGQMVRASQTADGKPFFLDDEDLFRQVKEKVKLPLYSVVVRIGVRTMDSDSSFYLAQNLARALNSIQTPGSNSLIPIETETSNVDHQVDLLLRMTHRSGMILNEMELNCFTHLPSSFLRLKRLEKINTSTREAPKLATDGITLGHNSHRNQVQQVVLPDRMRSRHIHIIGSTGSGKSNLLLNSIQQDIERGNGFGVMDPHGDLIDTILNSIPDNRIGDVILIDPSDEDFPIPFNILKAQSDLEKRLLASDLTSVFQRFATSWGDQMTAVLDNAVLAILNHPEGGTLRDLQQLLVEKSFREKFIQKVTDEQVVYYWRHEFPMLRAQPQASILTRLSMFLRPKPIRNMLLQSGNALDFEKIMDEKKILLIKLSHGLIGESNAHLLGALLVSKINQSVMARQAKTEDARTPFSLYIDEFHNFACQSMNTILSGARKYEFGLILAHQDMKQVESRDAELAESIISNPYARVCFRLGDRDAKRFESSFSHFLASDLQNLPIGNAICRFGQSDADFNLETERYTIPTGSSESKKQKIIDRCREKYATPKAEVEEALSAWLKSEAPKASQSKKSVEIEEVKPSPVLKEPVRTVKSTQVQEAVPAPILIKDDEPLPKVDETSDDSDKVLLKSKPSPNNETNLTADEAEVGIGGDEHRRLQATIKKLAEGFGYKAQIEKQILGRQLVDVALEKNGQKIAVEVSVTTPPAKEILNITKSLKAGYETVIMTSPNPKTLALIRNKAKESLKGNQLVKVMFLNPVDISSYLVDLEAQSASGVEEVMGWEVETIYTSSEKLGASRQAAQATTIGKLAQKITKPKMSK